MSWQMTGSINKTIAARRYVSEFNTSALSSRAHFFRTLRQASRERIRPPEDHFGLGVSRFVSRADTHARAASSSQTSRGNKAHTSVCVTNVFIIIALIKWDRRRCDLLTSWTVFSVPEETKSICFDLFIYFYIG